MIELTNTAEQIVPVGASITFDKVILHTGCAEGHRAGTGAIKMKACGVYEAHFSANITGATADVPVQLSLQIGGSTLPETTMMSTPSAANEFNNVATGTLIKNSCGDYDRVTVVNTGASEIIVGANPVIFVKRVS